MTLNPKFDSGFAGRYCKKKTSVPVIELLPLSSKFTFHFHSVKTDLGLLNILPLSQAQSIEGAVETGGKDCCLVPAGLPRAERKTSCLYPYLAICTTGLLPRLLQ